MSLVVSEAVTDAVTAVEKLRADDPVITSLDQMLGDLEMLLEAKHAIEAVLVRRLRAADAIDATSELHGRSTKRWLVEDQMLAGPEASRLMRLARQLPAHPPTQDAYEQGPLSSAHAAAILTALQSLPCDIRETVEPLLVERAQEFPPEEIAGFVDELLQGLGLDKASDARRERQHASRGLDLARTFNGTWSVNGTLAPELGEQFYFALTDAAGRPAGTEDVRTTRQRFHDALGAILNNASTTDEPSFTGAPRCVMVTIDLATLEDKLRDRCLTLPSGATISAATARRLACDAGIIPVVLGSKGEVLDIGQLDHEFTAPIRRAAWLRDGGRCVFPKCRNRCLELHHIVFRRHGGPTSLDNAAWLCAYHHWLVHEGGWTLRRQPDDGSYLWTSPYGRQMVRHLGTA